MPEIPTDPDRAQFSVDDALQTEHEQNRKLIAKLEKRIGELEQRIIDETQFASETMAASEANSSCQRR